MNKNNTKQTIITTVIFISVAILLFLTFGGQEFQRSAKSVTSNFTGGFDRTVTVYDYSGNEIKSYSGRFDVSDSDNEVYFDLNGKRIIIMVGL